MVRFALFSMNLSLNKLTTLAAEIFIYKGCEYRKDVIEGQQVTTVNLSRSYCETRLRHYLV